MVRKPAISVLPAGVVFMLLGVGDAAMGGNVLKVDPTPPGVVLGDGGVSVLKEAIGRLAQRKDAPRAFEVLAWAAKAVRREPLPSLHEEAIVLVQWKESQPWRLFYVSRVLGVGAPGLKHWSVDDSDCEAIGLATKAVYRSRPSEREIVKFVTRTNFGNNDFRPETVILHVFLYSLEMHELYIQLEKGVPNEEKKARDARYQESLVY